MERVLCCIGSFVQSLQSFDDEMCEMSVFSF